MAITLVCGPKYSIQHLRRVSEVLSKCTDMNRASYSIQNFSLRLTASRLLLDISFGLRLFGECPERPPEHFRFFLMISIPVSTLFLLYLSCEGFVIP